MQINKDHIEKRIDNLYRKLEELEGKIDWQTVNNLTVIASMQHYVKYEATKAEIQALETILEALQ